MPERRKDHRLDNSIPLKLCQEDGDIVTETENISRSGAYCRVSRYIEPMTKIKTQLLLPITRNGKQATKRISCSGVVVRIEEISNPKDHYNVAIFFNDISVKDSELIADYISEYLEKDE